MINCTFFLPNSLNVSSPNERETIEISRGKVKRVNYSTAGASVYGTFPFILYVHR